MNKARARAQAAAVHPAAQARPTPANYADAASDVWEALLRESIAIIHELIRTEGDVTPDMGARITIIEEQLSNDHD